MTPAGTGPGQRGDRRRGRGRGEEPMVPPAEFSSYYGRPVVKAAPWQADIPAYLFLGGLAAGSSLLAAGADLTDRPALRRSGRLTAVAALGLSVAALIHDLGRPARFTNMLRVMKPTSPMSVGTWILAAYGPGAALAGLAEVLPGLPVRSGVPGRVLAAAARPGGLVAAAVAPALASYTAALLSDTATPAWSAARRELPLVFVASAAAAAGGAGLIGAPIAQAGPARRLAVTGALVELVAERRMVQSMGLPGETLHQGTAGRLMRVSRVLTVLGGLGTAFLAGRHRGAAVASGTALVLASACTRFGIFHAGQASARDPRYTVVPQRDRLNRPNAEESTESDAQRP